MFIQKLKKEKYQELCKGQNRPANAVKNCSAECASKARNVVLISAIFYLLHSLLCLKKLIFFLYFSVNYRDRRKTEHPYGNIIELDWKQETLTTHYFILCKRNYSFMPNEFITGWSTQSSIEKE
jgi:hypothetical protein